MNLHLFISYLPFELKNGVIGVLQSVSEYCLSGINNWVISPHSSDLVQWSEKAHKKIRRCGRQGSRTTFCRVHKLHIKILISVFLNWLTKFFPLELTLIKCKLYNISICFSSNYKIWDMFIPLYYPFCHILFQDKFFSEWELTNGDVSFN